MRRLIVSQGIIGTMAPLTIMGIVRGRAVESVKVVDPDDGQPISWAMSDRALADCRRILLRRLEVEG